MAIAEAKNQGIPLIGPLLNKLIGSRNDRFVKKYTQRVDAINALEPEIRKLTDQEIMARFELLRDRRDQGAKHEEIMIEAFAVAREAMDRGVGIRNIFNPEAGFDPSVLPADARVLYEETKALMDACPPIEPEGRFLGELAPIPGWRQLPIPNALYEAVREVYSESRPPFRARPFDVQLIGAMVLSGGKIAEMKTGEGKTIVAPLATYLACVERMQVHVVTVNDYLVQRDRDWTSPFFQALGLSVGAIHPQHMQDESVKRDMYRCDVVYGTTSEFGFDYLRDNMKRAVEQQVQRKRQFAIVDEVDSILIDEARTPLIISGPARDDNPRYDVADKLARHMVDKQKPWQAADDAVQACKERIKGLEGDIRQVRDKARVPELQQQLASEKSRLPALESERDQHTQYYEVQLNRRSAHVTHEGIAEAQRVAQVGSFYVGQNTDLPHLLENAVRAHAVYQRDKDYVVMDVPDRMSGRSEPSVVIVDANTGRPMIGRQWSDGLHQAVECKERVPIKLETQTVATVTIQNFYKMYKRLAGMTGTADTEAQEFHDIYKLDVVSIPTNRAVNRRDYDDLMYLRARDKWEGLVDEIKRFHDVGRPILVGTTSVEKSELVANMLAKKHGVRHNVLNAKQHEKEAGIIEDAGVLGAVTIATNMAGRGTDIKLGKVTREALLEHWLKRGIAARGLTVESTEDELRENVYRKVAQSELGIKKREAEEMDFAELEIQLLRHWAVLYTWLGDGKIRSASPDELRAALDDTGRFMLHRIRWFGSVEDLGGLHVIGTERHESRRIDNQLRGRSGRQGDNGSSRFFVSFEDDLMKMFAGETVMRVLSRVGMKEGDAIEHPMLSKSVERAQRKVEERNFQIRKNILEYDEVMEMQRQKFYGLRQRVLEGRDVKGLIFEYIEDAAADAAAEYLAPGYPAECVAQFASERLEASIEPERLKGREAEEMDAAIRRLASDDARAMIDVTLGEYMPMEGSEVSIDFDSAGLVSWARERFGVELDSGELREGGLEERRAVRERLAAAAIERIEQADLSGLSAYLEPDYGARQLSDWTERKLGVRVPSDEIVQAQKAEEGDPVALILDRAKGLYRKREVEYPVDFAMEMAMALARQNPQQAFAQLADWSTKRLALPLDPDEVRRTPPAKIRDRMLEASEKFVDSGRLEATIEEALAQPDDEALDRMLQERFGHGIPESMRWLAEDERDDAVRALIENRMRNELLFFERTVLIETLDNSWRDHLYGMDQLRDGISFRAFSQQDPRIEYKREGSRLFTSMMETVRDRVTDYIFRARIGPSMPNAVPMPRSAPQPAPAARQAQADPASSPQAGAGIVAPGVPVTGGYYEPPSRQPAPAAPEPEGDTPEEQPEPLDAQAQVDAARAALDADRGQKRTR